MYNVLPEGFLIKSLPSLAAAKDHVKDNVKRMREIQAKCKQKQEEQTKPVKPLYRPDKYDHVPAKVTMYMKVRGVIGRKGCILLLSRLQPVVPELQLPPTSTVSHERTSSTDRLMAPRKRPMSTRHPVKNKGISIRVQLHLIKWFTKCDN